MRMNVFANPNNLSQISADYEKECKSSALIGDFQPFSEYNPLNWRMWQENSGVKLME
jgi:hypothetical protein